jgi:hypothetical protein
MRKLYNFPLQQPPGAGFTGIGLIERLGIQKGKLTQKEV